MPTDYVPRDEAVRRAGGVWQAVAAVLGEVRLSHGQARVLAAMLRIDGPNLRHRPGRRQIAPHAGARHDSTVGRILATLVDDGWIKLVEDKRKRKVWGYRLPVPAANRSHLFDEKPAANRSHLNNFRRRKTAANCGRPEPDKVAANCSQEPTPKVAAPGGRGVAHLRNHEVHVEVQSAQADLAVSSVHLSNTPNSRNDNTGLQPSSENQHGEKNRTTGGTAKLNPDPAALVAQAKADAEADGGDTRLVAGLSKILGAGDLNRATWCKIDRLAIGGGCIRGDRESVTSMLLDLARGAVFDGADNPAAAFTARIRCMPAMARAWGAAKARAPT